MGRAGTAWASLFLGIVPVDDSDVRIWKPRAVFPLSRGPCQANTDQPPTSRADPRRKCIGGGRWAGHIIVRFLHGTQDGNLHLVFYRGNARRGSSCKALRRYPLDVP